MDQLHLVLEGSFYTSVVEYNFTDCFGPGAAVTYRYILSQMLFWVTGTVDMIPYSEGNSVAVYMC